MALNQAHIKTFQSILELYGLSEETAGEIAKPLSHIDNSQQDQLIQKLIYHYAKKTKAESK